MNFEEKLIKLRKQNLLSQEELAQKLDVTRQTISKWELGQAKPDMDNLMKLSEIFNISVENLTNEKEKICMNKKVGKKHTKVFIIIAIILLILVIGGGIIFINKKNNTISKFNMDKQNVQDKIQEVDKTIKEAENDFKNKQEELNEISKEIMHEKKKMEEEYNETAKDVKNIIDSVSEKLLK